MRLLEKFLHLNLMAQLNATAAGVGGSYLSRCPPRSPRRSGRRRTRCRTPPACRRSADPGCQTRPFRSPARGRRGRLPSPAPWPPGHRTARSGPPGRTGGRIWRPPAVRFCLSPAPAAAGPPGPRQPSGPPDWSHSHPQWRKSRERVKKEKKTKPEESSLNHIGEYYCLLLLSIF